MHTRIQDASSKTDTDVDCSAAPASTKTDCEAKNPDVMTDDGNGPYFTGEKETNCVFNPNPCTWHKEVGVDFDTKGPYAISVNDEIAIVTGATKLNRKDGKIKGSPFQKLTIGELVLGQG